MQKKSTSLIAAFLFCILTPPHALNSATIQNKAKVYDVIIVGAGIAGLTSALFLADYDVLLLEKELQVGGRAASGQYKGLSYAKGPEYLGIPESPLKDIISTLHLNLREIPSPADVILYGGKMYYGDSGKTDLIIRKSSRGEFNRFISKIQAAYNDYDDIPELELIGEMKRLDTITIKQWFDENHFSPIYYDIFNVASRGLFGANINEISALSALPELAFEFEGFETLEDDEDTTEELTGSRNSSGMYSFDNGIAEIPLALGTMLGDTLQANITVTGVRRIGELFQVSCIQANKSTITYLADAVILATPASITLDIAAEVLNKEQKQLLGSVNYAPYATIALFSEKPIFNKGFDLAVPDGFIFTDIYDATWVSRKYTNNPASQKNFITLIYAAPASYLDTTLLKTPNAKLIKTVLEQLDTLLPGSASLVKDWEITRFQYGYPVMQPGSYHRMSGLQNITGNGLFLAGDYLIYPTFEAAASSGQLAAEKAIDWLED